MSALLISVKVRVCAKAFIHTCGFQLAVVLRSQFSIRYRANACQTRNGFDCLHGKCGELWNSPIPQDLLARRLPQATEDQCRRGEIGLTERGEEFSVVVRAVIRMRFGRFGPPEIFQPGTTTEQATTD